MNLQISVTASPSLRSKVELAFRPPAHSHCAAMLRRAGLVVHLGESGQDGQSPAPAFYSLHVADGAELARLPDDRAGQAHDCWDALFAVVDVAGAAASLGRMRGRVTEWLFDDFSPEELVFRVLSLLYARQLRSFRLAAGSVVFAPDTRSLYFGERTVRLTPSEFEVAELFFDRYGVVIPLQELVGFFERAGKSAAMNNIRVTIFQLRLKLEQLTRSQLTIGTIYRRGYVLKQGAQNAQQASEGRALLAAS